jgi:hypothetical protein
MIIAKKITALKRMSSISENSSPVVAGYMAPETGERCSIIFRLSHLFALVDME